MRILALFSLGLLSGCVTAHDYCVAHAEHYASYDECYAEQTQKKENLRNSLSHIGDRGQTGSNQITPPVIINNGD